MDEAKAQAAGAHGIPAHGEGASAFPPATRGEMDRAVGELQARRGAWAALPVGERRTLLARLRRDFLAVAERWADACAAAAGLPDRGETAITGPYFVLRNLRLLDRALADIAAHGTPRIPGRVRRRPDGQVTAEVFPTDVYDRLFYSGIHAEVWMEPGVELEGPAGLAATQAVAYRGGAGGDGDAGGGGGRVALVLGAGNVSSIGPMDALYKLFVDKRVVLFKTHPVNAYLGRLMVEAFGPLIEGGFFRLVQGGAAEGAYLCEHPGVDEVHITGSDKTYEAIVFGPGAAGAARKAQDAPRLGKPVSAELGNVSPVIVVPGPRPWARGDLEYQAENLATMLTNNAGFNCNALRVIVQHAGSPDRAPLMAALRAALARLPTRRAYYPGAAERYHAFLAAHPRAERIGEESDGRLPWTIVAELDPGARDDICFTTEAFCGLCGETAIEAASVAEYLDRAVAFCNDTLWGSLNVTLLVAPAALADPAVGAAFERAVAGLRYGTVSINHWAALGYGLVVTPWGAYPGGRPADIGSGAGVVHNTLMLSRVQKCVVRAPFHARPKPAWFAGHRTAARLAPRLAQFEAAPSVAKLPGIFSLALRG